MRRERWGEGRAAAALAASLACWVEITTQNCQSRKSGAPVDWQ